MTPKKILLLNLLLFLNASLIEAQSTLQYSPGTEPSNSFPKPRIACGPWIQAAGETEFTVVWETNVPCISWVEVAPDDGTNFYATERPKYYESRYGRRPVSTLHHVRIKDLQGGTRYRYRVFQQALLLDEGDRKSTRLNSSH